MFYRPEEGHGLKHNPFKAVVAPRPIGWISTRGPLGDNLAPYSFFNAVSDAPPQVMFAGGLKDTIRNVQDSGVFAVNLVDEAAWQAMNETSATLPRGVDEFARAGVEKAECRTIPCPRVATSPATLECRLQQIVSLEGGADHLVIGTVIGVHLRDDCLTSGRFDVLKARPMARLGYRDYTVVERVMELARPDERS